MPDILQIWERRARTNPDAIIKAVEGADSKIVKVRAGHVLTERLEVCEPRRGLWRRPDLGAVQSLTLHDS